MDQLDLDINNYTIGDLVHFFGLHGKFTIDDVNARESKIREQLLTSGHINKRFKRDLIAFLESGKRWIVSAKLEKVAPTSIPKNYQLDPIASPLSEQLPTSRATNLIERMPTQFVHAKVDEFYQGMLNPLENRVITRCVNIDTRFRDNLYRTQSSDFVMQLPFKLSKVVSMQMSAIELPIAFYGVSAAYGNHYFWVQIVSVDASNNEVVSDKRITISDGNYNAADLIDAINASLHDDSAVTLDIDSVPVFHAVEFVLDITNTGSGTGKAAIHIVTTDVNANAVRQIVLDFARGYSDSVASIDNGNNGNGDELSTKLGWNLGFLRPFYEGATTYIADTIIEPAAVRYLFLAVDDYQTSANNHFISAFTKSVLNPNILARITMKGNYFSLVMENDLNIVTEPRRYFGPVDIQRLRIRLFDEHGRIVNMNNANYSFCLNFKVMYE